MDGTLNEVLREVLRLQHLSNWTAQHHFDDAQRETLKISKHMLSLIKVFLDVDNVFLWGVLIGEVLIATVFRVILPTWR